MAIVNKSNGLFSDEDWVMAHENMGRINKDAGGPKNMAEAYWKRGLTRSKELRRIGPTGLIVG